MLNNDYILRSDIPKAIGDWFLNDGDKRSMMQVFEDIPAADVEPVVQPTGFLNAKRMPMRAHEDIIVCYKHLPAYHPQMRHGLVRKVSTAEHKRNSRETDVYGKYKKYSYDSTDRYPTSVLTFKSDKQKCALVPTQKPVALLEYLIRTYTDEGETVLDSCMGSGSTGVACVKTGRSFIGIELDYEVFSKAKTRIDEAENEQRKGAVSDA